MTVRNLSIEIGGMSCDGCVRSVRNTLSRVAGVSILDVVVGGVTLTLDDSKASEQEIRLVVEKAGFEMRGITVLP